MTLTATQSVSDHAQMPAARSQTDPILLELWEIKRQLNAEANYDIAELARRASAFDMAATMKKLGMPFDQAVKVVKSQASADPNANESAA